MQVNRQKDRESKRGKGARGKGRERGQRRAFLALNRQKHLTNLDLVELELLVLDSVFVGGNALDGDESLSRGEVSDSCGRVGQVEEDNERPEDRDGALQKKNKGNISKIAAQKD